jgi:hypothetical protein
MSRPRRRCGTLAVLENNLAVETVETEHYGIFEGERDVNPVKALHQHGQTVWLDYLARSFTEHSSTLGISLAADSQAAGRWSLDNGAEYYAAGVGTGIAGFRARLGLIDDPIRSRQDADSELIRDRIWDWYINDFKTRLIPHAAEILIQTRWSER